MQGKKKVQIIYSYGSILGYMQHELALAICQESEGRVTYGLGQRVLHISQYGSKIILLYDHRDFVTIYSKLYLKCSLPSPAFLYNLL